ncbi:serine palmitoyltransferase 1 isoform X2 [Octopus sinensis]|uniref:Serine palmitoyltransferase 1 n=1 Tax=Octopus sinensis TaxID=2607531 RepID=A0A6P7SNQ6_9MOLL|nr:serine palmitoyltransferase 1 isoform X2 [Octopus sinensis]
MAIVSPTWEFTEMIHAIFEAPTYHLFFEAILIICIIKLLFSKSYNPEKTILTEKEKSDLIADWVPQPLVPKTREDHPLLDNLRNNVISGKAGKYLTIQGRQCINIATFNFLGMLGEKCVEDAAIGTLLRYGVGSCGPRAFYGTMDVHLDMEDKMRRFLGAESAILYSYGFATVASAIPAYSKRGDVIFCDAGVCFSIQKGLLASRSVIKYFRHNDMDHLTELLIEQEKEEQKNPKKARITRKFVVVEAIYVNHGDICPLPKIIELKYKYKVRVFLEESLSIGVLGRTGRGLSEYYDVSIDDIDFLVATLENSFASAGGFCAGKKYIVDHQRLNGYGYCFSASQPPLCVSAACRALDMIEQDNSIIEQCQRACKLTSKMLRDIDGLDLHGAEESPVKHLRLTEPSDDNDIDNRTLQRIADIAIKEGVALTVTNYLADEYWMPKPSIRIAVNRKLVPEDIEKVSSVIRKATQEVLFST